MGFVTFCRRVALVTIVLQVAVAIGLAQAQQKNHPATRTSATPRPYSLGSDPNADPSKSLKNCLDHAGMNVVARDRCMRRYCGGRWGQGQCPNGGDFSHEGASANRLLDHCLAEAGANPFKRTACGWEYCRHDWDAPGCAQLKGKETAPNG